MTLPHYLPDIVKASYFIAALLFILGLKRMSSPRTARGGILWAGAGMLVATVATFFLPGLHNIPLIAAALVIGTILAGFSGKRVAMIASSDHGHAHRADGPYGFDPAAAEYDGKVVELIKANHLTGVSDIDPALVGKAKADSYWQMLMLAGAIGDGWKGEFLSYEAPTYFGMLCAAYTP